MEVVQHVNKFKSCSGYNLVSHFLYPLEAGYSLKLFHSIYLLECSKCEQIYIGESKRPVRERISEHAQYVRSILSNKAIGEHFNLPGHSLANIKFTILEQAKKTDDLYRKQRETFFINKFRTLYQGINRIE